MPTSQSDQATDAAGHIADIIIAGFNEHFRTFNAINAGAMRRFESADWGAVQQAARARLQGYDKRVEQTILELNRKLAPQKQGLNQPLWREVKKQYARCLQSHRQPELAESYYNSVFCNMHHRRYFHNQNIFVTSSVNLNKVNVSSPVLRSFNVAAQNLLQTVEEMITSFNFTLPFENLERDATYVKERFFKASRFELGDREDYRIDIINSLFFRSKAAYIVGRIVSAYGDQVFAIPILNNERGSLYLDTLVLDVGQMNTLFGFARAYFMVETESPGALVDFLQTLLRRKSRTELYTHIGFQKHGKTQFYRELLEHLDNSTDQLVRAPGIEGMVMTVFTLPSFPYVFKVIKDKFPPSKDTTPEKIKEKYQLVKLHDRVGRMADTLEYSGVALPRSRFSEELLRELLAVAPSRISHSSQDVIIEHLYIERRMTPLNIYLQNATRKQKRDIIIDYGDAIKQMIAVNIFPGDMLLKNFGVSRHGRVIFYDYDEVEYLTSLRFRKFPEAATPEQELADSPWYSVGPNDVFPEQFKQLVLIDESLRQVFMQHHAELLDASYWQAQQKQIANGVHHDVFPYPENIRFSNFYGETS